MQTKLSFKPSKKCRRCGREDKSSVFTATVIVTAWCWFNSLPRHVRCCV